MNRGISRDHINDVIAIDDRVLRNYWVTQTYADLSNGLTALLAPGTANWCTFGTWASWTVGGNMRGEALPSWLHDRVLLPDGLMGAARETTNAHGWAGVRHVLRDVEPVHLLDVVRDLLGEMAINLSDGNTEVFAEIAPPASVFIERYSASGPDLVSARAEVLSACDGVPEFEGVNRLRAGYSLWCDALECEDPTKRSQLILAGSLQLGIHEQNHLQPVIESSMDMGINQASSRLMQKLAKDASALDKVDDGLDEALRPAVHGVGALWDDLMTLTLGTLQSPEGTMRLDHDVPLVAGQAFEPVDLSPVVVVELATLRERFDRSHSEGKDSRALDWANFDDRMNFIANLFISRHHQVALFQAPFDERTLAAMLVDRIPTPETKAIR